MELFKIGDFSLSISGVAFLIFSILAIAAIGYLLGKVTVKGVNLGTAGVFIIALLFGCVFYEPLNEQLAVEGISYTTNALKTIESIGLLLFVTSVGFIAGPKFFSNIKKNFKTYTLLGLVIVCTGMLVCSGCMLIAKATIDEPIEKLKSVMIGVYSGALTSTPAFSAAKETIGPEYASFVAAGNGIAYIFGVIGKVLFIQLVPKLMRANMTDERKKINIANNIVENSSEQKSTKKLINIDSFGIAPFAIAATIGLLIGSIKFGSFSLTTTGGYLLAALVFGHFGRVGEFNITPPANTLKVFREFGLMMFLIGAGVSGGAKFVESFQPIYFLYGALITIVPMTVGFLFAKYVLKLNLLNNLGSISGGMTSTPALGALINVSGTEDVVSAYAATYPIALIAVVLASQILIMIF